MARKAGSASSGWGSGEAEREDEGDGVVGRDGGAEWMGDGGGDDGGVGGGVCGGACGGGGSVGDVGDGCARGGVEMVWVESVMGRSVAEGGGVTAVVVEGVSALRGVGVEAR